MKRSSGAKRHIRGSGGLKMKGPMQRQYPDGHRVEDGRKNKGRMHWEAKAQ